MDNSILENKKHDRRPDKNWLGTLLPGKLILKNKEVYNSKTIEFLESVAEKYRRLITISEPTEVQQKQIEEILELAVYDTALSELIDCVEEEIAMEIGISKKINTSSNDLNEQNTTLDFENNTSHLNHDNKIVVFPSPEIPKPNPIIHKYKLQINIKSAVLGGGLAILGVYIFNQCSLFTVKQSNQINSRSFYSTSTTLQTNKQKMPENPLSTRLENISKAYVQSSNVNVNATESNIFLLKVQKSNGEKQQIIAEKKQIYLERKQLEAEQKQRLAEARQSLEEAKQWKDKAQKYRQEAQYYLKQAKNYHNIAQTSFEKVQNSCLRLPDYSLAAAKITCP